MVEVRYREDLLLYSHWFLSVLKLHFGEDGFLLRKLYENPVRVETHIRTVGNLEVDVLLTQGRKAVAIELKESDYRKAITQALERRDIFDYVYVVLNLPVPSILSILRSYPQALEQGIGFISAHDNCIVIKAYSKHRRNQAKRYINLFNYLPEAVKNNHRGD